MGLVEKIERDLCQLITKDKYDIYYSMWQEVIATKIVCFASNICKAPDPLQKLEQFLMLAIHKITKKEILIVNSAKGLMKYKLKTSLKLGQAF